jgi:hypothetical protein
MPNVIKRCRTWSVDHDAGPAPTPVPAVTASTAWRQLVIALSALTSLALLLPSPSDCIDTLSGWGPGSARAADALSVGSSGLLLVAALAVWSLLLWGSAVALVAVIGRIPGGAGRRGRALLGQIAPGVARHLVLGAVGASIVAGLAAGGTGTAAAASVPGNVPPDGVASSIGRITDLETGRLPGVPDQASGWTSVEGSAVQLGSNLVDPAGGSEAGGLDIDWPAPSGTAARTAAPKAPVDIDWPAAATPVVVLRGDSLWSIAAHHLPADASSAQIEKAWQQWFSANASVIGPDPNLILPGQILQPPHLETGH